MARLLTTGFELGEAVEHNGATITGLSAAVTSPVRTGVYAFRHQGNSSFSHVISNTAEVFMRIAVRFEGTYTADAYFLQFFDGETAQAKIGYDKDLYYLNVAINNVEVAQGSIVLATDTWYVIEARLVFGAAGSVTVKINGVTDVSYSGNTRPSGNDYMNKLWCGISDGNSLKKLYVDDLALNDTSGTQQNSWVGSGGIYLLKPTADGASSQWTPSAGVDHYAVVDDVPANDSDWIYSDRLGDLDLFTLEDLPAEVTVVDLIEPVFQAALAEAGQNDIKHVVRHSAVNYNGDTEVVTSVAPSWVVYKSAPIYEVLGGAGAWSPAQVNALESGVEVA